LYERLSEESIEVLRVAQSEVAKRGRCFEVLKVGTAALITALLLVKKGQIVEVLNKVLWKGVFFTRWDALTWLKDPLARRATGYYLQWHRGSLNPLDQKFIEGYTGLGGRRTGLSWSDERKRFCGYFGYWLNAIGVNLNAKFLGGGISSCFGRDHEVTLGLLTLIRMYKNNPVFLGYAGVGKTALVEGTAARIVSGLVPKTLGDRIIFSVELSKLVAGTKYRGEYETKVYGLIREIASDKRYVLFIDEIHSLAGAGAAEGAVDAATLFKPAMSRGRIRLMGASTFAEYDATIRRDRALDRRFRTIDVNEPTRLEAMELLLNVLVVYEIYHGVRYCGNVIEGVLSCSISIW
jgi:ATP-dependent Clp protease ATP-binding subunit ClpA